MNINEMVPWITLLVTLALSILVPLFTQIANNRFQLKLRKQDEKQKTKEMKQEAYKRFMEDVGGCILFAQKDNIGQAGASIQRLYMYMPEEWWTELDQLYMLMQGMELKKAMIYMQKITKFISKDLMEKK